MPHPFFDATAYPWHRLEASALHRALYLGIRDPKVVDTIHHGCGSELLPLNLSQGPGVLWKDVLESVTVARKLPVLFELLRPRSPEIAACIAAAEAAENPVDEPVLPGDVLFFDRKDLRRTLETLPTTKGGVLLVRGERGAGNTWTEQLVQCTAAALGHECIWIFRDQVATLEEALEVLFTNLGGSISDVPQRMESGEAWFRRICSKLSEVAVRPPRGSNLTTWIVVDDLGEYENGPRLDRQIRAFFEQFVVAMANPAVGRLFRLVLIDYPGGKLPTRWKVKPFEDRPRMADVRADAIEDFYARWARSHRRQMDAAAVKQLASEIIAAADANKGDDTPRLRKIHDALEAALTRA